MPLDIDIKTGLPRTLVEAEKDKHQQELDSKLSAEGAAIEKELAKPESKKIIEVIREKLEERADYLIANDPECKGLINVLSALGLKIAWGKGASERIMKRALRK